MKFGNSWILAGCVALVFILAMAFMYGREARVRIEQAEAATSEQESTASISIEGHLLHFRSSAEASPTCAFYAHLVWKRAE